MTKPKLNGLDYEKRQTIRLKLLEFIAFVSDGWMDDTILSSSLILLQVLFYFNKVI